MSTSHDPRRLREVLAVYRRSDHRRSLLELLVTLAPLATCWGLALVAARQGWWWGALLAFPAAAFLVRLFMIQHDCGHGAFFRPEGRQRVDRQVRGRAHHDAV